MKPMNNSDIIKLACYKEMAPNDPDWFFVRAASIARHLYMRAPCGVGGFTKIYGGRVEIQHLHLHSVLNGDITHILWA